MELESDSLIRPSAWLDAETVADGLNSGINTAGTRHRRITDIERDLSVASLRANLADLGTVAEELVDNALSFSRQGTTVKVRAWIEGATMHFTVTDTGRGMTTTQLEQISAMQRREGELRAQQDLGFGLILVHRLVLLLRGKLRITSEPGKGTTSHVSLPIAAG